MSILSAIPAELITGAVSSLMAFGSSIVAMKQKQKADEQRMLIGRLSADEKSRVRAEGGSEEAQREKRWTRRVIALTTIVSVLVLPMLAPLVGINVVTGWTELSGGFWPFTDPQQHMIWHQVSGGVVITPLHTHVMMAIIGFYFGTAAAESARNR